MRSLPGKCFLRNGTDFAMVANAIREIFTHIYAYYGYKIDGTKFSSGAEKDALNLHYGANNQPTGKKRKGQRGLSHPPSVPTTSASSAPTPLSQPTQTCSAASSPTARKFLLWGAVGPPSPDRFYTQLSEPDATHMQPTTMRESSDLCVIDSAQLKFGGSFDGLLRVKQAMVLTDDQFPRLAWPAVQVFFIPDQAHYILAWAKAGKRNVTILDPAVDKANVNKAFNNTTWRQLLHLFKNRKKSSRQAGDNAQVCTKTVRLMVLRLLLRRYAVEGPSPPRPSHVRLRRSSPTLRRRPTHRDVQRFHRGAVCFSNDGTQEQRGHLPAVRHQGPSLCGLSHHPRAAAKRQ
uniref:Ubiquitin-like protease family profile domain-containing protein n=1 Tax=Plectus sambesii TaxID=2011161 RepID=A0A914WPW9_9BILA